MSTLASSKLILVLAAVSCAISAFVLNFTRGYPEENDESSSDDLPGIAVGIYFLALGFWVVLWGYSILQLYGFIGSLGPNVLFFGSLAWAAMLITHVALDRIEAYENAMYDF
ncbi:hypothetical protein [Halorientalis halophila]|uniref:hypothetical protein n=1 Tax=Halorientalis halophila TaxID=3108499 RepID=UPI00300987FA